MKNKKAKKGDKCTNCGFCCTNEICDIGKLSLPDNIKPPCPFLFKLRYNNSNKTKLLCKLVIVEKQLGIGERVIDDLLGIGKGCCSDDFG